MDEDPTADARTSWIARTLPLVLAALLAFAAVGTVGSAGCDEPGHYVSTPHGITLVGGCLSRGDVDPLVGDTSAGDPAARRG